MNPTPSRLTEIVEGLQAQLEGALQSGRLAVTHPGARGDASQEGWLNMLRNHLPKRYQADSAFVIDSRGDSSDQIDVVIYDRQYSPYIYNEANQRFVPAESVYAVLEVKQDLSRDHVLYAGEKAASVRKLFRTSAPVPHVEGVAMPRVVPPIIAGILAYQSSWTPPLGDSLREALVDLPEDGQLNLGCSLLNGVFEAHYPSQGEVSLTIIEDSPALVQFFLRLLKQLQSLGTAPAINYEAYLGRIRMDLEARA